MLSRSFAGFLLLAALAPAWAEDDKPIDPSRLHRWFGFGEMQIYKLKPGIANLRLGDLDGDGRKDIALWNSYENRIDLFYQPKPDDKPEPDQARGEPERNELPNRGPLQSRSVPVAHGVGALELGDVTGDQRNDLVFLSQSKELVVMPALPEGGFGPPVSVRARDAETRGGGLALGDFNGDRRTDAAVLATGAILIFPQNESGGFAKPIPIRHGIQQPQLMLTSDVNGDGRDDLILTADDDTHGVAVLLQDEEGALGAVRGAKVPKLRSLTIGRRAGGDDVFGIEAITGRLREYRWGQPRYATGDDDWPQLLYSFPVQSEAKRRPTAVGDIDGDGDDDVIVADPEAGQLVLFEQDKGELRAGVGFPSLTNLLDIRLADVDGDQRNEILCVSQKERMVGVSSFENGRLTFPRPLGEFGEPLAAAFGALASDAPTPRLAVLSKREGGVSISVMSTAAGALDEKALTFSVGELRDDPDSLVFADVNQDGRNDLLLFVRFSPLRTFLQTAEGPFEELAGPGTRSELVKEAASEDFALADVTGDGKPELLLAQKNLVRSFVVRDRQWTIVDQLNPEAADAQLKGLAVLPASGHGPRIVAIDRKSRELLVWQRREDGTFAVVKSQPVGVFDAPRLVAVRGGEKSALAAVDSQKLMFLLPDVVAATLVEQQAFETKIKDGWLADSTLGDLNHDGVRDIAVVEVRKANIEILTTMPDGALQRVLGFQVFQGKRFSGEPERGGEPREVLIGDVTGDGADDLVLLVHERLLIYPGQ